MKKYIPRVLSVYINFYRTYVPHVNMGDLNNILLYHTRDLNADSD